MPEAPEFNDTVIKQLVKTALKEVADFPDDAQIEEFTFQHFHEFHKKVFSASLKQAILNVRNDLFHYDIVLNEDIIDNWETVGDCISYLEQENLLCNVDPKVQY